MRYISRVQQADPGRIDELVKVLGVSPLAASLLIQRGITDPAEGIAFLKPSLKHLHDPFQMEGMDVAVACIRQMIAAGKRIVVYGDYDVDGVTAASILKLYLQSIGAQVEIYVPSRHSEGYGVNRSAVEKLAQDCALMITVDCGITSAPEIALALSLGMQTIVTDHHSIQAEKPDCMAVLHPSGSYPCHNLSGAGVALKLVHALGGIDAAMELIDLAAIGTVADMVPLLGENRTIVALGLRALQKNKRPGVKALCDVSGLAGKRLSAGHIGFMLGPRINAGGRMGHSLRSVEMLTTDDRLEAERIAADLNAANRERQSMEQDILQAANVQIEREMDFMHSRILTVCGEGWNAGVIGIVASRLVERWYWPTIVFSREGNTCVGSARSIKGVHLFNALYQVRDLFQRFGGHEMAAGMTLDYDRLPELRQRLSDAIREQTNPEVFLPALEYDALLHPRQISLSLVEDMEALQPTGMGNPQPVFRIQGAYLSKIRTMGADGSHLKLQVGIDGMARDAVAFRMGHLMSTLDGRKYDMLVSAEKNEWNGHASAQLQIKSMQPIVSGENTLVGLAAQRFDRMSALFERLSHSEERKTVEVIELEELTACMRAQIQGVLLLCLTPEAVHATLDWLDIQKLIDRVDVVLYDAPIDPRSFHALWMPPAQCERPSYERIVLMDGVWASDLIDWPDICCINQQWSMSPSSPTRENIGEVYRALSARKDERQQSARAWCEQYDHSPYDHTLCALHVLKQLQLIDFDGANGCITLKQKVKCELNDSRLYRQLQRLKEEHVHESSDRFEGVYPQYT